MVKKQLIKIQINILYKGVFYKKLVEYLDITFAKV